VEDPEASFITSVGKLVLITGDGLDTQRGLGRDDSDEGLPSTKHRGLGVTINLGGEHRGVPVLTGDLRGGPGANLELTGESEGGQSDDVVGSSSVDTLVVTLTGGGKMELEGKLKAGRLGKFTDVSALELMLTSSTKTTGSHVEAVTGSPALGHHGGLMDDKWIVGELLERTRSTRLLLSLTDDIGPGSVVGNVVRKSPSDLNGVGDLEELGSSRNDWVDVESRRDTAVGLGVSSNSSSRHTEW
jgi:hypothetical protein